MTIVSVGGAQIAIPAATPQFLVREADGVVVDRATVLGILVWKRTHA